MKLPKIIYVSGSVTSDPSYLQKFAKKELELAKNYYKVINPCKICEPTWKYARCMKVCIFTLLECTHIYMLSDWRKSKGARVELAVAKAIGLTIIYETT